MDSEQNSHDPHHPRHVFISLSATYRCPLLGQVSAATSKAQDMQQQGVEVKKLMTSKTFSRWKHCVDYYTPAKLTNSMMQIIENGDLGKAPQQVVQAMQSLRKLGCVFFTQNCVKPNRPELVTASQTKVCLLPRNLPSVGVWT